MLALSNPTQRLLLIHMRLSHTYFTLTSKWLSMASKQYECNKIVDLINSQREKIIKKFNIEHFINETSLYPLIYS